MWNVKPVYSFLIFDSPAYAPLTYSTAAFWRCNNKVVMFLSLHPSILLIPYEKPLKGPKPAISVSTAPGDFKVQIKPWPGCSESWQVRADSFPHLGLCQGLANVPEKLGPWQIRSWSACHAGSTSDCSNWGQQDMMEQKSKGQRRCKLPAEVWRRNMGVGVRRLHELLSAFPLYKFQTSVSVLCSFLLFIHFFFLWHICWALCWCCTRCWSQKGF